MLPLLLERIVIVKTLILLFHCPVTTISSRIKSKCLSLIKKCCLLSALIEIKTIVQENNSRVDEAKNKSNYMNHKESKNNQSKQQEENQILKNEDNTCSLSDNLKWFNIHIIVVPGGEEKEQEQEIGNLFEKIMKEDSSNFVKEIDMEVQEAQRIPNKMDTKRPTPRHIIIKMPKVTDKERILKAERKKKLVTYRGVTIRLSADFSKENL